jgi:hypothetical protein
MRELLTVVQRMRGRYGGTKTEGGTGGFEDEYGDAEAYLVEGSSKLEMGGE